jgi:hypothetical protein
MVYVEQSGKFFVWTKKGRAPTFAHDTHGAALAEATRLAKANPGKKFIVQQFLEKVYVEQTKTQVGEKEKNMKTIWFGSNNNQVAFANSQESLTNHGVTDPQSFTVNGDVSGLTLIDDTEQETASTQSSASAA